MSFSRGLPGLRAHSGSLGSRRYAEDDSASLHSMVVAHPPKEHLHREMEQAYAAAEQERMMRTQSSLTGEPLQPSLLRDMLNISPLLTDAAAAIVDDSFNKCFTSPTPDPWNWNAYLFPEWLLGVMLRHCVLFPLRLAILLVCIGLLVCTFILNGLIFRPGPRCTQLQLAAMQAGCRAWVALWNGVIKYHGPRPMPGVNKVWVANHTSIIDYVVLCAHSPFAVVMKLQAGWVRTMQTLLLRCLPCLPFLTFDRTVLKDRHAVSRHMQEHAQNPSATPLLIFPEGTCVNNEACIMFKHGAFDLGATVCPIAIKYNKLFVDTYWDKRRNILQYVQQLLSSWALVCDVWFLEPQTQQPGETADEFASRVQKMIADTAGMKVVHWDGYFKFYNLARAKASGLREKRCQVFADALRQYLPPGGSGAELQPAGPADGAVTVQVNGRKEKDV